MMNDMNTIGAITGEAERLNPPVSYPNDGSITSRLMQTKILRLHPGTQYDCLSGKNKLVFNISTLARRDDLNPVNENETPLLYAEEKVECSCCFSCPTSLIKFELFDSNTRGLFSVSEIREEEVRINKCCGEAYVIYPNIYNFKAINTNDQSIIQRYDSRSFYRTYDYLGYNYYKIGRPYVQRSMTCAECCASLPCCCCCKPHSPEQVSTDSCCCCCCCCGKKVTVIDDKRSYIDIFNMSDQIVGKFAEYYNESGCCCCENNTLFYEIYFPPDANEMVRLTLIGQIIFFVKLGITGTFEILPGNRNGIERFN